MDNYKISGKLEACTQLAVASMVANMATGVARRCAGKIRRGALISACNMLPDFAKPYACFRLPASVCSDPNSLGTVEHVTGQNLISKFSNLPKNLQRIKDEVQVLKAAAQLTNKQKQDLHWGERSIPLLEAILGARHAHVAASSASPQRGLVEHMEEVHEERARKSAAQRKRKPDGQKREGRNDVAAGVAEERASKRAAKEDREQKVMSTLHYYLYLQLPYYSPPWPPLKFHSSHSSTCVPLITIAIYCIAG